MSVGNIIEILDYAMHRYGWTIEYALTQPLQRLFLLTSYGLEDDIIQKKNDPAAMVLKQVFGGGSK